MRKILSIVVIFSLLVTLKIYTSVEAIDGVKDETISINTNPLSEDWIKNWGDNNGDYFESVKETKDGYIAVGSSYSLVYDAIIVKYDKEGNVEWQNEYGGNDTDFFYSVIEVEDGYITVGSSYSKNLDNVSNNGKQDAIIVKYDKEGNVVWQKNWGGNESDYFKSITETKDGYIVVGASYSSNIDGIGNNGKQDAIIVKYDKEGNIVWQKNWGGNQGDSFASAIIVDGSIVVVGNGASTDIEGLTNHGSDDSIIIKYDQEGNIVWQKSWGGNGSDHFNSVTASEGSIVAVGISGSIDIEGLTNKGYNDGVIVKYDKEGNIVWQKNWGGNGIDHFNSVTTSEGNFVVTGYIMSSDVEKIGYQDAFIMKYNNEGNVEWLQSFDESAFKSIEATKDGYVVAGNSYSTDIEGLVNHGSDDGIIIKYVINNNVDVKEQYECINNINYKKKNKYKSYTVGDKIEYNGENYYVIENSDENTLYLTLLKENPLTVEEINANGINSEGINILNQGSDSFKNVATNLYNGVGGINYYSSNDCNVSHTIGCSTYYSVSNIKVVIDNWANNTFKNNELVKVNGYKARLITINDLILNLGYDLNGLDRYTYELTITEEVPDWAYSNYYNIWTMSDYGDSLSGELVLQILESGLVTEGSIYDNYAAVRPVINLNKCVIDGGCYEETEEIGVCGEANNKSEQTDNESEQTVNVGNTLSTISNVLLITAGILILSGIILLRYSYSKCQKRKK